MKQYPNAIAIFGSNVPSVSLIALYLAANGHRVVGIVCPESRRTPGRRIQFMSFIERIAYALISWFEIDKERSMPFAFRYPTFATVRACLPACQIVFASSHNDPAVAEWLKANAVDIVILAGTNIIKEHILTAARIGFINGHSALLPKYRGAKSEFWIMLNRDFDYLGLTIHWVTPGLDQGTLLVQKRLFFEEGDTPESLRTKANNIRPMLFDEALRLIAEGKGAGTPQDEKNASQFSRPKPEDLARLKSMYPYL